jgi:hypothetical protein
MDELGKHITTLSEFADSLLAFEAEFVQVAKEDTEHVDKLIGRATALQKDAEAHLDAVKEVRRKLGLWVKAME